MRSPLVVFCFLISCARAASPHKEPVTFSITNDVGSGNSVFVVGNHADVGANDVTKAIKLRYTAGSVWTGQIAMQSGAQLQYKFIKRSTATGSWCDANNHVDLSGTLSQSIIAQPPAPYPGKTIYYLSGWSHVDLVYNNGVTFVGAAMTKIGVGRTANESLYKISGVGEAGENIEFVLSDGNGNYDNPPGGGNYLTKIDIFEVEDGNVFAYQPPATFSAPTIITHFVDSSVANIPGRDVHVYLPRGYTENTTRRYPVVYFHDGQNVFDPATAYNHVEWQADETATREISQGRMREAILVGIDNTTARIPEYQPPSDSYQGTPGRADAYANFVINNVRPYIDTNFRSLNDRKNTMTIGSSMGGLVSLYLGREFTTFGKIAVMSPALWTSPFYVGQVNGETKKPLRVHLDMGTGEPQDDFDNCLSMYDTHLAQGYAVNDDVEFVAGCGQPHNEAAWSQRLPQVLDFLLPAREEPNELGQRDYPPKLVILNLGNNVATFDYSALFGFTYTLQQSSDLASWSTSSTTIFSENYPWTHRVLTDSLPPTKGFWRLLANPAP